MKLADTLALGLLLAQALPALGQETIQITDAPGSDERVRAVIRQIRGDSPSRHAVLVGNYRAVDGGPTSGLAHYAEATQRFMADVMRALPGALGAGESAFAVESRGTFERGDARSLDLHNVRGSSTNPYLSGPNAAARFAFPGSASPSAWGVHPAMIEAVEALTEDRRSVRVIFNSATAEEIRADIAARRPILVANLTPMGITSIPLIEGMGPELERPQADFERSYRESFEVERESRELRRSRGHSTEALRSYRLLIQAQYEWMSAMRDAHRAGLVTIYKAPAAIPGGGPVGAAAHLAEAIADALRRAEPAPPHAGRFRAGGAGNQVLVSRQGVRGPAQTETIRGKTWGLPGAETTGNSGWSLSRLFPRLKK